jgi:hypothetical protein
MHRKGSISLPLSVLRLVKSEAIQLFSEVAQKIEPTLIISVS